METIRKWTSGPTEESCIYSLEKVYGLIKGMTGSSYSLLNKYGVSKDMGQELHIGLLLTLLIKVEGISNEMDQELHYSISNVD